MRVEQKVRIFLMVCAACFFAGCGSTKVENSPYLIEYEEMPIKEFKNKRNDIWNSEKLKYYDKYKKQEKYSSVLFSDFYSDGRKGYKLTDVFIERKEHENTVTLKIDDSNSVGVFDCEDYLFNIPSSHDSEEMEKWEKRFDTAIHNKKYNGHFTVYVYCKKEGSFWDGYYITETVHNIEGIPTQKQLDADAAAEEAERIAKEEAAKKAEIERQKKVDAKGKALAKGYIYHGVAEDDRNLKLFDGGALEAGHAYYLSSYMVYAGGSMGGAIVNWFGYPNYHYVDYASQKIKGEVVSAGKTFAGQLPISVVVAGSKSGRPVVLGWLERPAILDQLDEVLGN